MRLPPTRCTQAPRVSRVSLIRVNTSEADYLRRLCVCMCGLEFMCEGPISQRSPTKWAPGWGLRELSGGTLWLYSHQLHLRGVVEQCHQTLHFARLRPEAGVVRVQDLALLGHAGQQPGLEEGGLP